MAIPGDTEEAMEDIVADENTDGECESAGEVNDVLMAERVGFGDRLRLVVVVAIVK